MKKKALLKQLTKIQLVELKETLLTNKKELLKKRNEYKGVVMI